MGTPERGELTPDEVVNQVFVTALNHLSQMPKQASFRGWLYHIALQILSRADGWIWSNPSVVIWKVRLKPRQ